MALRAIYRTILAWTDQSVNCILPFYMFYLLYYTEFMD